jgi:signal transduction histidine kinase/DNA-binding response OmpR family regulator
MAQEHRQSLPDDVEREIEELRKGLLPPFLLAMPVLSWLWFGHLIAAGFEPGLNVIPVVFIWAAAFAAHRLRSSHYDLACWVVVLAMALALQGIVLLHPSVLVVAFSAVIAVAANALFDIRYALPVAITAWLGSALVWRLSWGTSPASHGVFVESGLLCGTALAVAWLSKHPLRTSMESALTGWLRARDTLEEVRQRRGELYRVVRALEEATYRIERMNNELIVARREAELARVLKGRFAATVSHELRGPLNLILGFASMMALSPDRYEEPLPDCYLADVDAIYRNSQHLAALVDDILDLSQIEVERLPLVRDRLDLQHDVVDRVLDIVRPLAERKGLELRVKCPASIPWVLADALRLRQVVLNLLNNAIRFTDRGSVTVRLDSSDDGVTVSICDTGPGIAPDDMPKLFQEFHRLQLTDTREEGGSGLGLSISKHLVELHGGRIWAESRRGEGSVFSFSIPLPGVAPIALSQTSVAASQPVRTSTRCCLVVHDDPALARLLGRYLGGYRVVGVPDHDDIRPLVDQLHPHAIVTHPSAEAHVLERLRDCGHEVPMVTFEMPRMREQAHYRSVLAYLIKPVAPEMLWAAVAKIGGNRELTVLLVDDEPDAVRLLERILTSLPRPYKVLKAYSGEQALKVMQQTVPDIVLIDLMMPGLSGEQVLERMCADQRLESVPVVIVSARDSVDGEAWVSTPISVRTRRPMTITEGSHCLSALLDGLKADYLSDEANAGSSP